ncbi:MAG: ATP synthase subunit I [Defluviitaleaceae bacterium]|nr:ATP synthase subunit I [Defluviitaleaceae bacterium]
MLSPLAKRMLAVMAVVALVGCVVSFVVFPTLAISIVYGITAGTIVSIFRFWLLEKSLTKSLNYTEPTKSRVYASVTAFVRTIGTIAALFLLGMQHPTINLFGVIYGVLNMQIAAYICGMLVGKESKNTNQGQ